MNLTVPLFLFLKLDHHNRFIDILFDVNYLSDESGDVEVIGHYEYGSLRKFRGTSLTFDDFEEVTVMLIDPIVSSEEKIA